MSIKVIVTGASGMVGEGVAIECLDNPQISEVLVIGRRPSGLQHPKLKEVLHNDFMNLEPIAQHFAGYDACFFCLGVTSVGKKEDEYTKLTYDLTMGAARLMAQKSPSMTFEYVSGAGTDSTEQGRTMWARVKGKTENDLMKLPFKDVYAFRPGMMKPTDGMKNTNPLYKYIGWLYPLLRATMPAGVCTLKEVALAMIHVATKGYTKKVVDVKDMVAMAKEEGYRK
ncbi:MAG: epimerase [Sphingobacteriales bacterium]|nr:MAG: epimerase [Sphingobacteriales bacterium]